MKRQALAIALGAALLAAGCSGSDTAATQPPPAAPAAATPDPATAQSLARTAVQGTTTDVVVNDAGIQARGLARMDSSVAWNSTAYVLALQTGQLAIINTGPMGRTVTSPLGGTAEVTVNGSTVTATFSDFHTQNSTLNGTTTLAVTSGSVESGSYGGQATFTAMRVAGPQGSYQLDGTATLSRSRSLDAAGLTVDSTWTANLTVQDANGASVELGDFVTVTRSVTTAGSLEATQTFAGGVTFTDVPGPNGTLSGSWTVSTPVALRLTGTAQSLQLVEGQLLFQGTPLALRLTVTAPNQVELAVVQPDGSVVVIETISWASLGGASSAD